MNTKVLDKLNKDGISVLSREEKAELIDLINNLTAETTKQKYISKIFEDTSYKNLRKAIETDRKYKEIIKVALTEADDKFEKAKKDYVKDKIDLAELSKYQGAYEALLDIKRKIEEAKKCN